MAFHFLRPEVLWLLPLSGLLYWLCQRHQGSANQWKQSIDPALLSHLLPDKQDQTKAWLPLLVSLLFFILVFAFAGPTWDKQQQPVIKNQDALVIVLDNTLSMLAEDKKPSRTVVAKRKIEDLLKRRTDGLTGLVVFSGSAHTVTPLTDDSKTILALLPAIDPKIMPSFGNNAVAGIEQGLTLFTQTGTTKGRMLLLTDEVNASQFAKIHQLLPDGINLSIISIGTATGAPIPYDGFIKDPNSGAIILAKVNINEMASEAREFGFGFLESTFNDSDIERLGLTETPQTQVLNESTQSRQSSLWIDQGVWLLWLALPFALLLFRRGWILMLVPFVIVQESDAIEWASLWQTQDQQAQRLLEQGDAKTAADTFNDPRWKAAAQYKAKNYDEAIKTYKDLKNPTANDSYNLGNAYTQKKSYEQAIKEYNKALEMNPDNADAKANKAVAEELLKQQKNQDQQNQDQQNQDQQNQDQQNQDQQNQDQQNQDQQNQDQQNQQQSSESEQQDQQQGKESENDEQEEKKDQAAQADNEEKEQTPEETKDSLSEQPATPKSPEELEQERALKQFLNQLPDDSSNLLKNKFQYQLRQNHRQDKHINQESDQIW